MNFYNIAAMETASIPVHFVSPATTTARGTSEKHLPTFPLEDVQAWRESQYNFYSKKKEKLTK